MAFPDYMEAFDGHPKIGDPDSLRSKYQNTHSLARSEQASVAQATDDTIEQLAIFNKKYEQKFGYIFIVCATGKSAMEMLSLVKQRLHNTPEKELVIAADEQEKIMLLRISGLFHQ